MNVVNLALNGNQNYTVTRKSFGNDGLLKITTSPQTTSTISFQQGLNCQGLGQNTLGQAKSVTLQISGRNIYVVDGGFTFNNYTTFDYGQILNAPKLTTYPYLEVSQDYEINPVTDYLINCLHNSFSVTLPDVSDIMGQVFVIKSSSVGSGVNEITIETTKNQKIDGYESGDIILMLYGYIQVMATSTGWIEI